MAHKWACVCTASGLYLVKVERRQDLACFPLRWLLRNHLGQRLFLEQCLLFPVVPGVAIGSAAAPRAFLESSSGSPVWLPAARVATLCLLETSSFLSKEDVNRVRISLRGAAPLARRKSLWRWRWGREERGKPRFLWSGAAPRSPHLRILASLPVWAPGWPQGVPETARAYGRLSWWSQSCQKEGREIRGRISESQPLPSVRASAVHGRQGGGPRGERWCGAELFARRKKLL